MKKLIILSVLGLFFINPGKTQMCYQNSALVQSNQISLDLGQDLNMNADPTDLNGYSKYYKKKYRRYNGRKGREDEFNFGFKAGLNLANISQNFKEKDEEYATKMRPDISFGFVFDIPVSEYISFQPALMYSSKGFYYDFSDINPDGLFFWGDPMYYYDGYITGSYNYIEVPLNMVFKLDIVQLSAGPYVAFGIGGKYKADYNVSFNFMGIDTTLIVKEEIPLISKGTVTESDLEKDADFYNFLDFGFNAGLGIKAGPVVISAAYSLGLGNLTPNSAIEEFNAADYIKNNRVINVSVTYFFLNN